MVFNRRAYKLICASNINQNIIAHDWWCYQLISGSGGNIFYDKKIHLKYRQHNNNIIGSNISLKNKWDRLIKVVNGEFKKQNTINLAAIKNNENLLTKKNKNCLNNFINHSSNTNQI